MKEQTVYLRGLPRSGTNLLQYLLQNNFHVNLKKGSKHGIIPIPDQPDLRLCYITKHPVDWIQSIYAYGHARTNIYISEYGWPRFIYEPVVMLTGPRGMWFRSPVDVWNCYIHHYGSWKNAIHIKWEDCRSDQSVIMNMMQQRWGLVRKGPMVISKSSMNTDGTPTGQPFTPRRRDGMWKPEMIKWVEERALLKELGYGKA